MNVAKSGPDKWVETIADDELPIQLTNDALGCPHCHVELTNRKSRVFIDGRTIGMFDSIACEFCGFFLLTEEGFDESAKVIRLFGLNRLEQDVVFDYNSEQDAEQQVASISTTIPERTWERLLMVSANHLIDRLIVAKPERDKLDTVIANDLPPHMSPPPLITNKRSDL